MIPLILHHFEPMWDKGLRAKGIRGGFEQFQDRVIEYLIDNDGEQRPLIITRLESQKLDLEHAEWFHYYNRLLVREYAFGWSLSARESDNDNEYIEGGQHSELVLIADWMRLLPKKVEIAGCFDGECIEDLEIALRHLEIEYHRVNELIV